MPVQVLLEEPVMPVTQQEPCFCVNHQGETRVQQSFPEMRPGQSASIDVTLAFERDVHQFVQTVAVVDGVQFMAEEGVEAVGATDTARGIGTHLMIPSFRLGLDRGTTTHLAHGCRGYDRVRRMRRRLLSSGVLSKRVSGR